jgi:serine/threonine protein kinase
LSETSDRAESVFATVLSLASAAERAAYLDSACAGDPKLRAQVEALLHERAVGRLLVNQAGSTDQGSPNFAVGAWERPGVVIAGRYKLLEAIGEGGMGSVWAAEQIEPVRRKVAVKLIRPGMDSNQVLARFEAERQALALMDHPNIAKVLDGGLTEAGRPFFVMELVKGTAINEYCDAAKLSVSERLELFIPVCQAVQHAHHKGIIHRDLKPTNILIAPGDGRPVPKVIDFGLAKAMHQPLTERTLHTGCGTILGTPLYMSPEQAELNNLDVDTRTDVYSLGVLLYELLTGTTPLERKRFKEAAWDEIRRLIREEEPPRPSTRLSSKEMLASLAVCRRTEPARLARLLRGELDWIVMKALEKDRNRRYETADGLAMDVRRFLAGEAVLAAPPSTGYRLRKFARKHRGALTTAAAFGALLVTGAAVSIYQAVRATRAEKVAIQAREAEATRAESEKNAKQAALAAADAEKAARAQAQKRLTQLEKANAIITSIFADLDIREVKAGGEPLEAILAKKLVEAADQLQGEAVGEPLVVAALQERLGKSLVHLGYHREAIPLFVKALETRKAAAKRPDRDALLTMNDLATAYLEAAQLDIALPLLRETVGLMKTTLGTNDPDTLSSMNNLATAYEDEGKFDLALPLHEETLSRRKAALGAEHPETLLSMNNLAAAYHTAGELGRALALHEDAFRLRKAKLGADHPDTLQSMHNLALTYQSIGNLEKSLPLLEETRKLMKIRLGADHPDTLTTMNNLAVGYRDAKKLDQAIAVLEETYRLMREKLGAKHPHTLTTMNNLGTLYQSADKLTLAVSVLEETLKLRKDLHGTDHPNTLISCNNLALAYRDAGRPEKAIPLLEEATAGFEKRGFRYEDAERSLVNLVRLYERLKQFERAEAWRRKWLTVIKQRSGAESANYARELAGLGQNLLEQQRWTEAEQILRECLAIRQKKEPDDWATANTFSMLGGALFGQKRYRDAEQPLLAGYDGMKCRAKMIPEKVRRDRLREAVERLVRFYDALDKKDAAAFWRKELDAINKPPTR